MRTLRSRPWRWAKSAEQTIAAADPQVGGQAINRVITPGQIAAEAITSSSVTTVRNKASGLFAACRLALAQVQGFLAALPRLAGLADVRELLPLLLAPA